MPRFTDSAVRVTAPATSANLGPGFDALALALTVADSTRLRVTRSGLSIEVTGEQAAAVPRDERHLVVRAMRAAFDAMGGQPAGLHLRCTNTIPQGRGLGSSAAAIVSGVLGARALVVDGAQRLDDGAVLELAARLEGHPDNVAACLRGGLTVAWRRSCGIAAALRRHVRLDATLFVPPQPYPTAAARHLLPEVVAHTDAVRTAGRAALLVAALTGADATAATLLDATEDWLHQPYRAAAMPESLELVRRLRSSGIPAVLSGAGPAVLTLGRIGGGPGAATAARWGVDGWTVRHVAVDPHGAQVEHHPGGMEPAPRPL